MTPLKASLSLEFLDLSENKFCETEWLGKLIGLGSEHKAKKCFFSSKFSYFLIPTEAQNESLKVLKLAWNNIRLGGASSIINGLKVSNKLFKYFYLSFFRKM